jgi:hypothetical protein
MKRFLEIIIDDKNRTIEILNWSSDDTHLINNVVKMQNATMAVRCTAIEKEPTSDEIIINGYSREEGLYSRLLIEYEKNTGESLKRW